MNVLLDVVEESVVIKQVENNLESGLLNLTLADGTLLNFVASGEDEFTIDISEEMMAEIQNKLR